MISHNRTRLRCTTFAVATLLGLAAGTAMAQVSVNGNGNGGNPYSPRYGHPYRHGALPTREVQAAMQRWAKAHPSSTQVATGTQTLSYGGGVDGIGVQSGHSKVYLVYYGTQWGTQGTDSNGNATFSGDPSGAAPVTQMMFKGIGTGSELWSAELTQWCDGPNVASGATSCPSNATFIPYQSGGVLAGVWYDNSVASPASATGNQLGQEAVSAAAHFGNTTAASNRDAYYVILSPHGTNPDNYQSPTQGYCAWHDYNGDSTLSGGGAVSSPYGDIAFSNQPYNIDQGAGCGVGFVNGASGNLDGYTMTLGHEWHEMMSDQNPAGGWTNHTGDPTYNGQENSDECAWIAAGQPGGAANIVMGNGTYTEQASWSNDTNSCAISHPIVGGGGGGGTPTANFSFVTNGLTASFTDSSTDSGGTITSHSWTFGDGASSTATSPSHTYAAAGTYSVTETVTDSASGKTSSKTSSVAVSSGGGGGGLTAVYNSTLKAPGCAAVGSSCDSGPSLLLGRGTISGGVEANQPNTINNSCADGTSGTFHSDESNDRLMIATTDGTPFAAGKTVKVTATVWAWSTGSSDALDLYYAPNANSPSWTLITTIMPPAGGAQALSATFVLPSGSLQAVRANFRYQGSASSCSTGAYDDHDDLIFAVGGGATGGTPTANFTSSVSGLTANFTDTSTDSGGTISAHSWTFGDGGTSTATSPSHTYAAGGTFSVTETVTDSVNGKTSSKTASVTVSSGGGSSQLLGNTGFESATMAPWAMTAGVDCPTGCSGESAHSGVGFAWLDGYGTTHTDTVSQGVAIPSGKTSATLAFYLHIDTAETGSVAYDTLQVQVLNGSGTVLATLATYSNVDAAAGYALHSLNMGAYIGQTVTVKFTGTEDASNQTSFVLDDVTLTVQ